MTTVQIQFSFTNLLQEIRKDNHPRVSCLSLLQVQLRTPRVLTVIDKTIVVGFNNILVDVIL